MTFHGTIRKSDDFSVFVLATSSRTLVPPRSPPGQIELRSHEVCGGWSTHDGPAGGGWSYGGSKVEPKLYVFLILSSHPLKQWVHWFWLGFSIWVGQLKPSAVKRELLCWCYRGSHESQVGFDEHLTNHTSSVKPCFPAFLYMFRLSAASSTSP